MGKHFKELVDTETGEITFVDKNYSPNTHEIRNRKQLEYQKNYMENRHNQFTWALMENVKSLLSENKIKLTTLGAVLILLPYLDNDGYLKRRTVEGKPCLTRAEILNILKLGAKTFENVVKELKATGILIIEGGKKSQVFKLNPELHLRGQLPEGIDKAVRIQNRGLKALFEEGNAKLDAIGFYYLLIPYLSYDCCMLVRNVNFAGDNENAISVSELCEELGMTPVTVRKYLSLKFDYKLKEGYYQLPACITASTIDKSNKKVIIVNPLIFRRNEKDTGEIGLGDMSELFRNLSKKL